MTVLGQDLQEMDLFFQNNKWKKMNIAPLFGRLDLQIAQALVVISKTSELDFDGGSELIFYS